MKKESVIKINDASDIQVLCDKNGTPYVVETVTEDTRVQGKMKVTLECIDIKSDEHRKLVESNFAAAGHSNPKQDANEFIEELIKLYGI